jgi:hypothetical protein
MTLLQAWADSLSLLKPKHLYLFTLVTLKSLLQTYKLLLIYWSWLYIFIVGCYCLPFIYPAATIYALHASQWMFQVFLFAVILTTRPSLEQKKCAYFRQYILYFLPMVPFLFLVPFAFWPAALSPFYFLYTLFYLDSPKYLRADDILESIGATFKMIIYNYPLFFIFGLVLYIPVYVISSYIFLPVLLHNVMSASIVPFSVCLYTNVYIKKLHDQFDLYYKQPK